MNKLFTTLLLFFILIAMYWYYVRKHASGFTRAIPNVVVLPRTYAQEAV